MRAIAAWTEATAAGLPSGVTAAISIRALPSAATSPATMRIPTQRGLDGRNQTRSRSRSRWSGAGTGTGTAKVLARRDNSRD